MTTNTLTNDFNAVTSFFGGLFSMVMGEGASLFSGIESFLKMISSWFTGSNADTRDPGANTSNRTDGNPRTEASTMDYSTPVPRGALSNQFSATTQTQATLLREQQALLTLGYHIGTTRPNGAFTPEMQRALQEFSNDHGGLNPADMPGKLDAYVALAEKDVKAAAGTAAITTQQAYAMRLASLNSGVSYENIFRLAAAERAFEPGISSHKGHEPGLIQMSPTDWLKTVAEYGGKYGIDTSSMQVTRDAEGHVTSVNIANPQTKQEMLDLRNNMRLSALLGVDYAKHHAVQLDIAHSYEGEDGVNDQTSLSHFFAKTGAISCNPGSTAWCAAFTNTVLRGSGHSQVAGSNKLWAPDFENYGAAVEKDKVKKGDVVVFSFGHVALVDKVYTDSHGNRMFSYIGGNQWNGRGNPYGVTEMKMAVDDQRASFREPPASAFAIAGQREQQSGRSMSAPGLGI